MNARFDEAQTLIEDFADHFLVRCPRCRKMACVARAPSAPVVRVTCGACNFFKDWKCLEPGVRMYSGNRSGYKAGRVCIGAGADMCFHYPLWLSTPCRGQELWAYNAEHLAWLKGYLTSRLRERRQHPTYGWRNASLASRLPKWMKTAGNRAEIGKAIERLEALLQQGRR